jgi:FkbM family methyltransferase
MNARSEIRRTLRYLLGRQGFELRRVHPSDCDLDTMTMRLLEQATVVLDVGANHGGFVDYLRGQGYEGRVVSFEPLPDPYATLERRTDGNRRWQAVQVALSSTAGPATMRRSGKSDVTSSLLTATPALTRAYPGAKVSDEVPVMVSTLDAQAAMLLDSDARPFVKIDAQGSEMRVFEGAQGTLGRTVGVLVELSFVELYEGQPLFGEVVEWLADRDLILVALAPAFHDIQTRQLLQVDALFAPVRDPSVGAIPTERGPGLMGRRADAGQRGRRAAGQ